MIKIFSSSAVIGLSLAISSTASIAAPPEVAAPMIVIFHESAPFHQFTRLGHLDNRLTARSETWGYLDRGVLGAVQRLENLHRFKSRHVFSHAAKGFAVDLTPDQVETLRAEPTISYIEPDQPIKVGAQTLPWGIDRVEADRSSTRAGDGSGAVSNVNVYVIDTGIAAHADLNLVSHLNFIDSYNTDCHGHGTHVAGSIAARDNTSAVVGVAPGARLFGLKVLDCAGSGSTSTVIKAVDWVTANAVKPAVANLSLGGGASQALDDAVRRSAASSVFYSVAAGNSGTDACGVSPARAGFNDGGQDNGIVTTAAVDQYNREPSWSNYGRCVNVWAPGVSILSTRAGGGTLTMSGTSMAAPHVAGAAALFLSRNTASTPGQVEAVLRSYSISTRTNSKDGRAISLVQSEAF